MTFPRRPLTHVASALSRVSPRGVPHIVAVSRCEHVAGRDAFELLGEASNVSCAACRARETRTDAPLRVYVLSGGEIVGAQ